MAVLTVSQLKANMVPGQTGGTTVSDIHDIIDTFDDRIVNISAPAIVNGAINLQNYSGVQTGALDAAGRLANASALQAAFDAAASQNKYLEIPAARYEYTATKTQGAVNVGLQCGAGVPGFEGDFERSLFVQYAADHPCLTIGEANNNKAYGRTYKGLTVTMGVDGTANSRGFLIGAHFQCRFIHLNYNRGSSGSVRNPQICWDHVTTAMGAPISADFFSNEMDTIILGGGKAGILNIMVNGTGSVWNNTYLGGGGDAARLPLTGSAFNMQNHVQSVFNQLNIEWVDSPAIFWMQNNPATVINSFHIERCRPTGANPAIIMVASDSTNLTINGLQFYDNEFMTHHTGTPSLFTNFNSSKLRVNGLDVRFKAGSSTYGRADTLWRVFNVNTSGATNGTKPIVQINNFQVYNYSAGLELDSTLPRATYGDINAVGEYRFRKQRSEVVDGTISSTLATNETIYGATRHCRHFTDVPLTAEKRIFLSNRMAATGFGSTIPVPVGSTVTVVRPTWCTGAFNLLVRNITDTTTLGTLAVNASVNTEVSFIFNGTDWVTA